MQVVKVTLKKIVTTERLCRVPEPWQVVTEYADPIVRNAVHQGVFITHPDRPGKYLTAEQALEQGILVTLEGAQ